VSVRDFSGEVNTLANLRPASAHITIAGETIERPGLTTPPETGTLARKSRLDRSLGV